jgi:hypothetical protein
LKSSKALKNLKMLQEAGIKISDPMMNFVSKEDAKARGVVQIWGCKKCNVKQECFIRSSAVSHSCNGSKSKELVPLYVEWEG